MLVGVHKRELCVQSICPAEFTTTKDTMITTIEAITDDAVLIVCTEDTAKQLLKRNPLANVQHNDNEEMYGLVYSIEETNLMNAVKRK